jgi:hypothetical protein
LSQQGLKTLICLGFWGVQRLDSIGRVVQGKDMKKYINRCRKRLKEWNAPLEGWRCIDVYDAMEEEDRLFTCQLCDCPKVRFVHVMQHEEFPNAIHVGCICAGVMEDDILAAKERERQMRNRAKRKKTFAKRIWEEQRYGWSLSFKGDTIQMFTKPYLVRYKHGTTMVYKGKKIDNFLSAVYAAFDMVDPI